MSKSFRIFLVVITIGVLWIVWLEYIYPNTTYCKNAYQKLEAFVETLPRCDQFGQPILAPGQVHNTDQKCSNQRFELLERVNNCKGGAFGPINNILNLGRKNS